MPVEIIPLHCSKDTGISVVTGEILFSAENFSENRLEFVINPYIPNFQDAMDESKKRISQILSYAVAKDLFKAISVTRIGLMDNGEELYETSFDISWPKKYSEQVFGTIKVISAAYNANGAADKAKLDIYQNTKLSLNVDQLSMVIDKEIEGKKKARAKITKEKKQKEERKLLISFVASVGMFFIMFVKLMIDYRNGAPSAMPDASIFEAVFTALIVSMIFGVMTWFVVRFFLWLDELI